MTYEARHGTVEVVDDTWISTSEILQSIPGKKGTMVPVCMLYLGCNSSCHDS